jgi:hypothetical protein
MHHARRHPLQRCIRGGAKHRATDTPVGGQCHVPGAQTAGNLNVVVVGWSDTTSHVLSVTDSLGNTYALAAGPTVQAGVATQSIYYSAGITGATAGGNTVTVQFDAPAIYVDMRIAEYSGIDVANPVDVVVAAMGSSGNTDTNAE